MDGHIWAEFSNIPPYKEAFLQHSALVHGISLSNYMQLQVSGYGMNMSGTQSDSSEAMIWFVYIQKCLKLVWSL